MQLKANFETQEFRRKKFPTFGQCIYCDISSAQTTLTDEHIVPYSLGGTAVIKNSSCSECAKITSQLELHLARTIFGHYRVHANVATRNRGRRPRVLPATIKAGDEPPRDLELPIKDHPFFTYLPVWDKPGMLTESAPTSDFKTTELHQFQFVPDHFRKLLDLGETDALSFPITVPLRLSENQFSRALAKIAYCTALTRYGLNGFERKTIAGLILGSYPYAQYLVGSSTDAVLPPTAGVDHIVAMTEGVVQGVNIVIGFVRLFANSGIGQHGMPIYTVVIGAKTNSAKAEDT